MVSYEVFGDRNVELWGPFANDGSLDGLDLGSSPYAEWSTNQVLCLYRTVLPEFRIRLRILRVGERACSDISGRGRR
jgi:hypothetical protein